MVKSVYKKYNGGFDRVIRQSRGITELKCIKCGRLIKIDPNSIMRNLKRCSCGGVVYEPSQIINLA